MGKIRVKVLGDEQAEKDQQKKAQQRAEAKKVEAAKQKSEEAGTENVAVESEVSDQQEKKVKRCGLQTLSERFGSCIYAWGRC